MKTHCFIAAVAALGISTVALTADPAFATKFTPLQGKYTKDQLDATCKKVGGTSYGDENAYGCTKGQNSVECTKGGTCYAVTPVATQNPVTGNPTAVLQQSQAPVHQQGVNTGVVTPSQ